MSNSEFPHLSGLYSRAVLSGNAQGKIPDMPMPTDLKATSDKILQAIEKKDILAVLAEAKGVSREEQKAFYVKKGIEDVVFNLHKTLFRIFFKDEVFEITKAAVKISQHEVVDELYKDADPELIQKIKESFTIEDSAEARDGKIQKAIQGYKKELDQKIDRQFQQADPDLLQKIKECFTAEDSVENREAKIQGAIQEEKRQLEENSQQPLQTSLQLLQTAQKEIQEEKGDSQEEAPVLSQQKPPRKLLARVKEMFTKSPKPSETPSSSEAPPVEEAPPEQPGIGFQGENADKPNKVQEFLNSLKTLPEGQQSDGLETAIELVQSFLTPVEEKIKLLDVFLTSEGVGQPAETETPSTTETVEPLLEPEEEGGGTSEEIQSQQTQLLQCDDYIQNLLENIFFVFEKGTLIEETYAPGQLMNTRIEDIKITKDQNNGEQKIVLTLKEEYEADATDVFAYIFDTLGVPKKLRRFLKLLSREEENFTFVLPKKLEITSKNNRLTFAEPGIHATRTKKGKIEEVIYIQSIDYKWHKKYRNNKYFLQFGKGKDLGFFEQSIISGINAVDPSFDTAEAMQVFRDGFQWKKKGGE